MATNNRQARPLKKYDHQIIKATIKQLCESENLSESIDDLKLAVQTRLGKPFRTSFIQLLRSFRPNFDIEVQGSGGVVTLIKARTNLELCQEHCKKQSTCDGLCRKLHVCKFFLLSNSCAGGQSRCKYGHDFTSSHNQALLRENHFEELDTVQLQKLFKNPKNRCLVTQPTICKFYSEDKACRSDKSGDCPYLHLCKAYATGNCIFGRRCRKSHNVCHPKVKDSSNVASNKKRGHHGKYGFNYGFWINNVLKKYGIDAERRPKDILVDLRSCFRGYRDDDNYDSDSGQSSVSMATDGKSKPSAMGRMNKSMSKSNPCLATKMSSFSIAGDIPMPESQELDEKKTSVIICIYHLRGKCQYKDKCYLQHKNSMYQWQFRNARADEWTDFRPPSNTAIEKKYCDVDNSECSVFFGKQLKMRIDFVDMKARKGGTDFIVRRLSTDSSAAQKLQPLATKYRWYWHDQRQRWISYGEENVTGFAAMLDSDSLEMNYQENPVGQMKFKTSGHDYIMDFTKMVQRNVIHKTERPVRRRPVFVDNEDMEIRKKRSADTWMSKSTGPFTETSEPSVPFTRTPGPTAPMNVSAAVPRDSLSYIPPSWSFDKRKITEVMSDHNNLVTCQLSSSEAVHVKKSFYETMPKSFNIVSIKRIENGELWMNYTSKREKMQRKKKDGNINEIQLFHGTNEDIIDAICRQGFDFRFSGSKVGHKYGKGSYFAKMAQTADSYTDYGDRKHMFIVRVLAGDYAPGETNYVRPPPRNPRDPFELFDSCVDNVQNPNIFVIFTFDQAYPEYVIEYQRQRR